MVPPNPKEFDNAILNFPLDGSMPRQVDVRIDFRGIEVDRWRCNLIPDGQDAKDQFDRPCRPKKMTDRRFCRRHGNMRRMGPEQALHGRKFNRVCHCRGAMCIDVVDFPRRHPCPGQCRFHATKPAVSVFGWRGHMVCVTGKAEPEDFSVNSCSTRPRVFKFLENDDSGPFTHDETVAFLVPGPRCTTRIMRPGGRECATGVETGNTEFGNRTLGTTRDHDIRISHHDETRSIRNRVCTGRTRGNNRMVGALESVPNGHLARSQIDESSRDKERGNSPRAAVSQYFGCP